MSSHGGGFRRWAWILAFASIACESKRFVFPDYGDKPPPTQTLTFFSTDGQVFPDGADVERITLRASGAHDMSCPIDQVTVQTMTDQRGKLQWAVDGCGRRALYFWDVRIPAPSTPGHYAAQEHHAVLSGLVPLSPATGP